MVDKSEKLEWLVRLGFAARGLVYALLGYLALVGGAVRGNGTDDVFSFVRDIPLGPAILAGAAVGLLGYGLYRIASPLFDIEHHGSDWKGIAHRLGHAGSAIGHLILAVTAIQIAMNSQGQSGGGGSGAAQDAAATLLSVTLGSVLLGLLGLAFLAAGVMQAKKGVTASFMRRVSPRAPDSVRYLGMAGHVARGIVFAVIGWSLIQSAWFAQSDQVRTLGEALGFLHGYEALFMLVAAGLLMFGIFSLFMTRYRIIPDLDSSGLKPVFKPG